MTLEKRDILQVNATIIAGLLILITIQTSVSSFEVFDNYLSSQGKLEKLTELIQNSNDTRLNDKASERIIEIKIDQAELLEEAENDNIAMNVLQNMPLMLFAITMIPFIGSYAIEMRDETRGSFASSTQSGRNATYVGFVFLLLTAFFFVVIRLIV